MVGQRAMLALNALFDEATFLSWNVFVFMALIP